MVQGELEGADPTQITLLASVRVAVFDDIDAPALRTLQTVHDSLNTRHAQKSTTIRRMKLTKPE